MRRNVNQIAKKNKIRVNARNLFISGPHETSKPRHHAPVTSNKINLGKTKESKLLGENIMVTPEQRRRMKEISSGNFSDFTKLA
jgi:hypothetical protein